MLRTFKTRGQLFSDGWWVDDVGLRKNGGLLFPRQLEHALGTERRVTRYGLAWLDAETNFVVPEEALEPTSGEPLGCSCGAKHTSLPQFHSDWCREYRKK
jgi:hypothetical protein